MENRGPEKVPEDIGTRLLSGEVSPEAFLKELLARDQEFGNRHAAILNIGILNRPEIRGLFMTSPDELPHYENFLSFSYFHRGQIQAIEEHDDNAAAASFNEALDWAKRAEVHDASAYCSWRAYAEGTAAYFNKDLATLKRIYNENEFDLEDERNKEILGNLMNDLGASGEINYQSVYGK